MKMLACLLVLVPVIASVARAETLPPERAVIVTLKWEANDVSLDKVDRKEMPIPVQRGFGQLMPLFYELRSPEGDVYYASGLKDPLKIEHSNEKLSSVSVTLVLPDIPEAKHLVLMKRVSLDPDKGRQVMKEFDL